MAPPKRKAGGRVTPKGSKPGAVPRPSATGPISSGNPQRAQEASSRYTPPVPKALKVSPPWVPVLMFALLIVGSIVIVLNYLSLLPAAPTNWYLLAGLGLILGGIVTATQYR